VRKDKYTIKPLKIEAFTEIYPISPFIVLTITTHLHKVDATFKMNKNWRCHLFMSGILANIVPKRVMLSIKALSSFRKTIIMLLFLNIKAYSLQSIEERKQKKQVASKPCLACGYARFYIIFQKHL
jgi:hypothetical protein